MDQKFLSPAELAEALGISVRTIYNWRVRGFGPVGIKLGRRVLYRQAEVEEWLARLPTNAVDASASAGRRRKHQGPPAEGTGPILPGDPTQT